LYLRIELIIIIDNIKLLVYSASQWRLWRITIWSI